MWYRFRQNNSGGSFVINDKVAVEVFIDAEDYIEANYKATRLGIYFNGCETGYDCPCCGDRWSQQYDYSSLNDEGDFTDIHAYLEETSRWRDTAYVYFMSGEVLKIGFDND
jgi:hypothetical protein